MVDSVASIGRVHNHHPEDGRGVCASAFLCHDRGMDGAYYEEIGCLLHDLLIRLNDRLPGKDATLIAEFIDVNELGLALEQMADLLAEYEQPLSSDERADMLSLAGRMQMGDRVPRALELCPKR